MDIDDHRRSHWLRPEAAVTRCGWWYPRSLSGNPDKLQGSGFRGQGSGKDEQATPLNFLCMNRLKPMVTTVEAGGARVDLVALAAAFAP